MAIEVERKFQVDDLASVERQASSLGAGAFEPGEQADTYFAHPARDFAATDEALRVRSAGNSHYITYKGPKLDATTKTRREIELAIGDEAAAREASELLVALGFAPVALVRKRRSKAVLEHQGWQVEIALDDVAEVGQFVELEIIAGESEVTTATAALASLAQLLGLGKDERRSYLELLLQARRRS